MYNKHELPIRSLIANVGTYIWKWVLRGRELAPLDKKRRIEEKKKSLNGRTKQISICQPDYVGYIGWTKKDERRWEEMVTWAAWRQPTAYAKPLYTADYYRQTRFVRLAKTWHAVASLAERLVYSWYKNRGLRLSISLETN